MLPLFKSLVIQYSILYTNMGRAPNRLYCFAFLIHDLCLCIWLFSVSMCSNITQLSKYRVYLSYFIRYANGAFLKRSEVKVTGTTLYLSEIGFCSQKISDCYLEWASVNVCYEWITRCLQFRSTRSLIWHIFTLNIFCVVVFYLCVRYLLNFKFVLCRRGERKTHTDELYSTNFRYSHLVFAHTKGLSSEGANTTICNAFGIISALGSFS